MLQVYQSFRSVSLFFSASSFSVSQTVTAPSVLAVTNVWPSGRNATETRGAVRSRYRVQRLSANCGGKFLTCDKERQVENLSATAGNDGPYARSFKPATPSCWAQDAQQ